MSQTAKILIIDDEPDICQLLELTLSKMNIASESAYDLNSAKQKLTKNTYNLCLTDMRLPDGSGLELLSYMQKNTPSTPVAVITAHGNMETAILAMKQGAFDFINKPIDLNHLRNLVQDALNIVTSEEEHNLNLVGQSQCIQNLRQQITKIARSQAPVYISGPSGSGKELVAKLIHQSSPRRDKPFIPVNCGAIPQELMESEFFGHKKGSFTGAHQDKVGFFEAAHQGTLFLDEVADLPQAMQVKLLRSIQEKSFRPVGATQETLADVRILCATHKNLQQLVNEGAFREDLFYRLNVIELKVPSLSQRIEDIPLLVNHILQNMNLSEDSIPKISAESLNRLTQYSFPGNIRELENILERAITLCDNQTIHVEDLQLPQTNVVLASPAMSALSLDEHLFNVEKQAIEEALEQTKGNKTLAAKLLGISFRTLRYRLKKLGIQDEK